MKMITQNPQKTLCLLVFSLALNLFLALLLIGKFFMMHSFLETSANSVMNTGNLEIPPSFLRLPKVFTSLKEDMDSEDKESLKKNSDKIRDLQNHMAEILRHDPLNIESFNEEMARTDKLRALNRTILQQSLIAKISSMPLEDRQRFADELVSKH